MAWTKNEFKAICYHEAGHAVIRRALGFTVRDVRFWPEPDPDEPLSEDHGAMTFSKWEGESDPQKWSAEVLVYHAIGTRAGELAEVGALKRGRIKRVTDSTQTSEARGYEQSSEEVTEVAQGMVDDRWRAIDSLASRMYRAAKDDLASNWIFELNGDSKNTP